MAYYSSVPIENKIILTIPEAAEINKQYRAE